VTEAKTLQNRDSVFTKKVVKPPVNWITMLYFVWNVTKSRLISVYAINFF